MSKKIIAIALFAFSLALVNCKDNSTTDDPEPAKTLNKSLMTNKIWKTVVGSSGITHYFRSDGKYCLSDGVTEYGTWEWLNNSDSMLIDKPATTGKTVWYAEYCTETEMKMRISGNKNGYVFTKQ